MSLVPASEVLAAARETFAVLRSRLVPQVGPLGDHYRSLLDDGEVYLTASTSDQPMAASDNMMLATCIAQLVANRIAELDQFSSRVVQH